MFASGTNSLPELQSAPVHVMPLGAVMVVAVAPDLKLKKHSYPEVIVSGRVSVSAADAADKSCVSLLSASRRVLFSMAVVIV